jgi:hypothetical protein
MTIISFHLKSDPPPNDPTPLPLPKPLSKKYVGEVLSAVLSKPFPSRGRGYYQSGVDEF